jgi:hypothetical protein
MQKHGVPNERWGDLVDEYYKIDRNQGQPSGLPPALDADLRAFAQAYPSLGRQPAQQAAPAERPAQPARPAPKELQPPFDPRRFAAPGIAGSTIPQPPAVQPAAQPAAQAPVAQPPALVAAAPQTAPQQQPAAAPAPTAKPSSGLTLKPVEGDPFDPSWSDVPGQAISNLPSSAAKFAKDLVQPILHPIDTANAVADLGKGLASKAAGALGVEQDPAEKQKREAVVEALAAHLKERYGSAAGVRKALATDPVGVMADFAMVLTGGGAVAVRGPGVVGKVGQIAQTAGSIIDPLTNVARAGRAAGSTVSNVLSATTGAGARSFDEAVKAGRTGNQVFVENMRGNAPLERVVDMAEGAVNQMGKDRSAAYKAGMSAVGANSTPVNFDPIRQALDRAQNMVQYKGIQKSDEAASVVNQMTTKYNEFLAIPKAERNAEALDALKQALGDIWKDTKQGTTARTVASEVYTAAKAEITKQVPSYAQTMKDYSAASDAIGEMRRTLSINDKASTDTTLRKLQSVMRNNVNTSWGYREKLLDDLARHAPDLPAALAGQSLNTAMPRGLARLGPISAFGAAWMNPAMLAVLPFQSPRLMGEAAYGAGRALGVGSNALASVGLSPARASNALRASYLANYANKRDDDKQRK